MKKIILNKKLVLIILIIILFIILLTNYIKKTDFSLAFLSNKQEKTADEILFKKEKNQSAVEKTDAEVPVEKSNGIENIALISEIKDPFSQNENKKAKTKENESFTNNTNQKLLVLEKDIVSEKIKSISNDKAEALNQNQEQNAELKEKNIKVSPKMKIPFKLLGIVKNDHNSAALFLYQGRNVLKKENEKIDLFKIQKIDNKSIKLSYQNKIKTITIWEEDKIENSK